MAVSNPDNVLASSDVFAELAPDVLRALEQSGRHRVYRPRETLFQKGDSSDFLVAILQGCVRVVVYSVEGREIVLNIIEPGQVVGEIGMLDHKGRTADAVAIDDVEALVIDRAAVKRVLMQHP
ncbi:MAG: cyclic nucleotide-binding domain-containing protein, partial [Pseudomonadota bacterium]